MGRPVEWTNQLAETLRVLQAIDVPVVTTFALSSALRISPRHASRLMRQFGAQQEAGGYLIDRKLLVERLLRVQSGEQVSFEKTRQKRLVRVIFDARKTLRARETALYPAPVVAGKLPRGVRVVPGKTNQLVIDYTDAIGLLSTLMEIGQLAAEDLDEFKTVVGDAP